MVYLEILLSNKMETKKLETKINLVGFKLEKWLMTSKHHFQLGNVAIDLEISELS